jgi:hypothetical protein
MFILDKTKKKKGKKDIGVHLGTTYGASKKRDPKGPRQYISLSRDIWQKQKGYRKHIHFAHRLAPSSAFSLSTSESSRPVMFWAFGTQPSTVLIFAFYSVFTSCMLG